MARYSNECELTIETAKELAKKSQGLLGTEHMIGAMLMTEESKGGDVLREFGVDANEYVNGAISFENTLTGYTISKRMAFMMEQAVRVAL